jgi:hypothetical protein
VSPDGTKASAKKLASGRPPRALSRVRASVADFTDPLTTLPQISFKDAFIPANFGTHVQTNQAIIRPIIPRLPQYSLFPFVQLIRPWQWLLRLSCEYTKATLVPLASRLYCGQILTKEGAAYVPLEFIEKRLRTRG